MIHVVLSSKGANCRGAFFLPWERWMEAWQHPAWSCHCCPALVLPGTAGAPPLVLCPLLSIFSSPSGLASAPKNMSHFYLAARECQHPWVRRVVPVFELKDYGNLQRIIAAWSQVRNGCPQNFGRSLLPKHVVWGCRAAELQALEHVSCSGIQLYCLVWGRKTYSTKVGSLSSHA